MMISLQTIVLLAIVSAGSLWFLSLYSKHTDRVEQIRRRLGV